MRTLVIAVVSCLLGMQVQAQQKASRPATRVVETGLNHRVLEYEDEMGRTVTFTELEAGMNHRESEQGPWVPSREEIIITQDGDALAAQGPIKVRFAANLNTEGAIRIKTQEGVDLKNHLLGLAYVDAETGESVLIAEVKDSIATILGENVVLYEDAFVGADADVRYVWRKGSFEQDIILRSQPPSPEQFGLNPETARLTVWTEFLGAPKPKKAERALSLQRGRGATEADEAVDETLEFGSFMIGDGKAFPLHDDQDSEPVTKRWIESEERQFLMEEVPWPKLKEAVRDLPEYAAAPGGKATGKKFAGKAPPQRQFAGSDGTRPKALLMASADQSERMKSTGYVLDYQAVVTQANLYLMPYQTYGVSGTLTLSGTTRIGGGTVVKYNTGATLQLQGILACETTPWAPAIFTGYGDNTAGESLSGSGTFYATTAIKVISPGLTGDLHDIKVRYATTAIDWSNASGRLSNIQLDTCAYGIKSTHTGTTKIHNLLGKGLTYVFQGSGGGLDVQHATIDSTYTLCSTTASVSLKNSVLNNVGFLGNHGGLTANSVACVGTTPAISGAVNPVTAGSPVFTPVGFGGYYLHPQSGLMDRGTTGIDATLAAEIRRMSVRPPQILTGTLPANSILDRVALLDTDTPDLGYHYAPLDYVVRSVTIPAGGTLILTNGASMGIDYNGSSWGVSFGTGAKFISQGTPTAMNRFIPAQASQERGGSKPGTRAFLYDGVGSSATAEFRFRFTELSQVAGDGYFVYVGTKFAKVEWSHCHNIGLVQVLSQAANQKMGLTNSLWINCQNSYSGATGSEIHLWNNTMRESWIWFNGAQSTWTARDNLFDSMGNISTTGSSWTSSHNAYWNCTALPGATSTPALSSLAYASGPLGNYYLASTSSQLFNVGSRTADQAGLFHFTTETRNVKETNSVVDIGYHYVAVGANTAGLISHWQLDGNANDAGGNVNNGTALGGLSYVSGVAGTGSSHDGVDDRVEVANTTSLNVAGALTLSAWFKLGSAPSFFADIVSKDGENTARQFLLGVVNSSGVLKVRPAIWTPGLTYVDGTTPIQLGRWYHVAMTYDGASLKLYLNGQLDASAAVSGSIVTTTQPVRIGGGAPSGQPPYYFNGQIDDVLYHGRALTQPEVAAAARLAAVDTDGDGLADYFEDLDGDGTVDAGETSWTVYNSPNGLAAPNGINVYTPLK